MRVFLDTNVLASAFGTRGLCADVFRLVVAEHTLVTTEPVLIELERVLALKFHVPAEAVQEILNFLRHQELIPAVTDLPGFTVRDPTDVPILATALSARVDVLVTGDGDLLTLNGLVAIPITDPRGFWSLTKRARSS